MLCQVLRESFIRFAQQHSRSLALEVDSLGKANHLQLLALSLFESADYRKCVLQRFVCW